MKLSREYLCDGKPVAVSAEWLEADRWRVRVGDQERSVGPGSILYVEATSEHSFVEIDEDVTLLVFFASGGPSPA